MEEIARAARGQQDALVGSVEHRDDEDDGDGDGDEDSVTVPVGEMVIARSANRAVDSNEDDDGIW
jgi:hypothetical protein